MKTITRMAAATATLLALGGTEARAQLIELPMGTGGAGDLTAHQIRVVQFALRDQNCYRGPISGRWTAATRNALQCARQRTNANDATALARELALWSTGDMATRSMAGDVAPASGTPSRNNMSNPAAGNASRNAGGVTSGNVATRDTTMQGNVRMRDTSAVRSSNMMRDTSAARSSNMMRDTSAMRSSNMMRDSSAVRSANMMRDSSARRDSSAMPMTPTDPLSPMSRTGTTTATRDSIMASRAAGNMSGNMDHGAMLAMQLDSLVTAAESGLAGMPAARSGALLQSVETHLAGTPGLADLGPEFATLRTQLATVPMDSAQVGRTMSGLSTRINAAAAAAPADVQARLRRLGTALGNEGRRLSP